MSSAKQNRNDIITPGQVNITKLHRPKRGSSHFLPYWKGRERRVEYTISLGLLCSLSKPSCMSESLFRSSYTQIFKRLQEWLQTNTEIISIKCLHRNPLLKSNLLLGNQFLLSVYFIQIVILSCHVFILFKALDKSTRKRLFLLQNRCSGSLRMVLYNRSLLIL